MGKERQRERGGGRETERQTGRETEGGREMRLRKKIGEDHRRPTTGEKPSNKPNICTWSSAHRLRTAPARSGRGGRDNNGIAAVNLRGFEESWPTRHWYRKHKTKSQRRPQYQICFDFLREETS